MAATHDDSETVLSESTILSESDGPLQLTWYEEFDLFQPVMGSFELNQHFCDLCPFVSAYKRSLVAHRKTHFYGASVYTCDVAQCSYSSPSPHNLRLHKRIHDKKYTCLLCPYKAAAKCDITKHVKSMH